MKNSIKIFTLLLVLFCGMNLVNAQSLSQNEERPEVVAKKISDDLTTKLSLNGDQQRALFRAYTAYETNCSKYIKGKDQTDPEVIANKKKYDASLDASVKQALTDAQYKQWQGLQKS